MAARSPTMVTLRDTQFVECRWWNDGWTVKTVVTSRSSSASVAPAPAVTSHPPFMRPACLPVCLAPSATSSADSGVKQLLDESLHPARCTCSSSCDKTARRASGHNMRTARARRARAGVGSNGGNLIQNPVVVVPSGSVCTLCFKKLGRGRGVVGGGGGGVWGVR